MDGNYSLSDVAAVTGRDGFDGFGGGGAWVLIILFALIFGNGGFFGNGAATAATTADIQRAVDLNSIQRGQADIAADVQRTAYEVAGTVKDASYNNLGEIRDVQAAVSAGFAQQAQCCCETKQMILENRYLSEKNAASVAAAVHAEGEATRNMIQGNKIADLTAQVQDLKTQSYFCGVPRINPYMYGVYPYNTGCCAVNGFAN